MQVHRHDVPGAAALGRQAGLDLLELLQLVRRPEVEQGADLVVAAHRRAEEAEAHRLAHHQPELLGRQFGLGAFLHAEGGEAQGLHRRFHAGDGGHRRLDRHVVGLGRAAADAHPAAAPHVAVVGRAAGHRQVEVGAAEQPRRGGALGGQPAVDEIHHPPGDEAGLEHAAVEEHRGGVQEARLASRFGEAFELGGGAALAAQEGAQVAGDCRVLGVGQAELGEAAAGAAEGRVGDGHLGEKAVEQAAGELVAGDLGADAAADEPGAAARHDHRHRVDAGVAEQGFLGHAAGVGEGAGLPRVEGGALAGELARHAVGEGQVHVVAAEEDVLADRDPVQLEVAVALQHGDQRQVGGAAADVHHQDDVALLHLFAPLAGAVLDPAVQRGLGLFEQGDAAVAGGPGSFGGEFAGGRVEGGGDRHGDVLLRKGGLRVGGVPGVAQVRQVADRGGQRRDARYFGRRLGGQDRRAAVDARVA